MTTSRDHPRALPQLIWARERLRLSRPQLAKKIGVDRTVVYKVEVGIQETSMEIMGRWLDVLGPNYSLDLFKPPPRDAASPSQQQHEPAA